DPNLAAIARARRGYVPDRLLWFTEPARGQCGTGHSTAAGDFPDRRQRRRAGRAAEPHHGAEHARGALGAGLAGPRAHAADRHRGEPQLAPWRPARPGTLADD